jgi:outer membrane lipoprotein-sorting protein
MMKKTAVVALAVAMSFCLGGGAYGETLEEVEQALVASSKNLKSYEADMTISGTMSMEGFSMVTSGTGHTEYMQVDGKQLSRSDMSTSMVTTAGGQETSMDSKSQVITDGEFAYTMSETMGQKMATKTKVQPGTTGAASEGMFTAMADANNLKVLAPESVDGEEAFVIQITPKESGPAGGSSVMYFAKKNGMWLKMVMRGPDGKPMQTVTLSNIKVNGDIDASRFKFVAPEGVTVTDMTQM